MLSHSSRFVSTYMTTIALSFLFGVSGCKSNKGDTSDKPVVLGDPVVKCDALSPGQYVGLTKSANGKILLFEEFREKKFVLDRVDIEGRLKREIGNDVRAYRALANGGVVFVSKSGTLFYLKKGLKEPSQLTPGDVVVRSFAVEEISSTIVYVQVNRDSGSRRNEDEDEDDEKKPKEIFQVALDDDDDEPKKMTEGKFVIGAIAGEKAVLLSRREGKVARVPIGRGEEKVFDIGMDRVVLGQTKGHIVVKQRLDKNSKLAVVPIDGRPQVELDFGIPTDELDWTDDGESFFVYEKRPNGALFRVDGATVVRLPIAKRPRIKDIVALDGDTFAALTEHDVNGNGHSDPDDETELCFIERHGSDKPIEIPTRTVPIDKLPIADKLAPLLKEPDLDGATMSFQKLAANAEWFEFDTPKESAEDFAGLRKRARDLQARIVEILGPTTKFGLRVQYANAKFAESRWIESRNKFLSYSGVGTALIAEASEYDIDLFPSVGFMTPGYTFGPALCTGKVRNIGQNPIENVTVTCSVVDREKHVAASKKAPLSPAKLAPKATGTYRMIVTAESSYMDFRFSVTRGDVELSQFNSYASDQDAKIAEVAVKVYAKTGLRYMYENVNRQEDIRLIAVQASPEFDKLGEDEQKQRAQQALDDLYAILQDASEFNRARKLRIIPSRGSAQREIKWLVNGEWRKNSEL